MQVFQANLMPTKVSCSRNQYHITVHQQVSWILLRMHRLRSQVHEGVPLHPLQTVDLLRSNSLNNSFKACYQPLTINHASSLKLYSKLYLKNLKQFNNLFE